MGALRLLLHIYDTLRLYLVPAGKWQVRQANLVGDGAKKLLAVVDGYRESTQSWRELLQQLKRQGLSSAPKLAIARYISWISCLALPWTLLGILSRKC